MEDKKKSLSKKLEGVDQSIKLFGEEHLRKRLERFKRMGSIGELFMNYSFKGLYERKVLDPKVRQLCTISGLTTLNALTQLKTHILGALRAGATEDEVKEAIFQMAVYCGQMRVVEAFNRYEEVMEEQKKEKAQQKF